MNDVYFCNQKKIYTIIFKKSQPSFLFVWNILNEITSKLFLDTFNMSAIPKYINIYLACKDLEVIFRNYLLIRWLSHKFLILMVSPTRTYLIESYGFTMSPLMTQFNICNRTMIRCFQTLEHHANVTTSWCQVRMEVDIFFHTINTSLISNCINDLLHAQTTNRIEKM